MDHKDYDILIVGGTVYDGLGNPGQTLDIAIKEDKIYKIGSCLGKDRTKTLIDASGLCISPGFIDPHSHTDVELLVNPKAESKIRQGITTEISGNCGFSMFPLSEANFEEKRKYTQEKYDVDIDWKDIGGFFRRLEERGIALNYATLVGHGSVRSAVFGHADRPPSDREMEAMKRLVRECMEAGAVGLSTGLIYTPGCFARTEEIIELCREVAAYRGIYATHMRNEGDYLMESVEEAIQIAQEAKVSLQISHLKLAYPRNWSKLHSVLSRISEVKAQGMEILADRYPYTATSTLLNTFIPRWVQQGSTDEYLARLKDPALDEKIRDFVKIQEEKIGSWKNVFISSVLTTENQHLVGKSIEQAAAETGKDPYRLIRDLLIDEEDQVWMINFSLSEDNFKRIIAHPLVVIGSDGWALAPYGTLGRDKPHPRSYGTFPRMLGRYVRDENLMPPGIAIEKMTSLTARKFGLKGRGQIKTGFFADIVVFDLHSVIDLSNWTDPHQYGRGIEHVIVNGQIVISEGEHTGALPGKVLKKIDRITI
jgi:N-acyl-D-amino-acid deacylase